jgi:hypothetical protein
VGRLFCAVVSAVVRNNITLGGPVDGYVHRHITGSTLRLLQARGHCPNLSAPAETVAAIQDFVAGGAAGRR